MANYRHELVSELKYVWERFLSKRPGQKLILCGSIASFMVEKVLKSSALYGRIETELEVPAFKLAETQQMLPGKGFDEILQAHLLTGGVPKYLELLRDYLQCSLPCRILRSSRTAISLPNINGFSSATLAEIPPFRV